MNVSWSMYGPAEMQSLVPHYHSWVLAIVKRVLIGVVQHQDTIEVATSN